MTQRTDHSLTALAAADLSAKQFRFVVIDSSGNVAVAGDGVAVVGVLENNPKQGQAATVAYAGLAKVVTGTGGLTPGAAVASDANGAAVAAGTGKTASAICIEGGVAGDLSKVLLTLGPGQVM